MKKILMAVAIAGAFVAAPASAQWYIGGGVGQATAKMGTQSYSSGGFSVGTQGSDSHDTSAKIFGGYQFTPNWGLEVQYVDLGRYDYNISTNVAGVSGRGTYKANTWGVAATGTLPLGTNFFLMGKLGLAANHVTGGDACVSNNAGTTICQNSGKGNKTDLLAGIGLGYNFNKNWAVRVEYENFGKLTKVDNGGDIKGDNWAVSVKYAF